MPDLPGTGLFHNERRRMRLGNCHHLGGARSFSATPFSANLAPQRISSRVGMRCDSSALRSLERWINVLMSCFMVVPPSLMRNGFGPHNGEPVAWYALKRREPVVMRDAYK